MTPFPVRYYFEWFLVFFFCFVFLSSCLFKPLSCVEFLSVIVTHSVCRYGETHGDDGITSLPAPCPGENWRVGPACAFRTSSLLKKCWIDFHMFSQMWNGQAAACQGNLHMNSACHALTVVNASVNIQDEIRPFRIIPVFSSTHYFGRSPRSFMLYENGIIWLFIYLFIVENIVMSIC